MMDIPSSPEGYGQSDRVKLGLDHSKIVGVTTLDVVRTNRFTSNLATSRTQNVQIPVIGGHAGVTILPLFLWCSFPR